LRTTYKVRHVSMKIGKGEKTITLQPGQFIFGRNSAAKELGEPATTIRNRMKKLVGLEMIAQSKDTQYSIVTICNWEDYQSDKDETGQSTASLRPGLGQSTATNKKVNKDKKDKNVIGATKVPDDFQVTETMKEWAEGKTSLNGSLLRETEKFIDHYRGNGQTKKDWIATWRNWMRRAEEFQSHKKDGAAGSAGTRKRIQ
jgi:hypothetical protein